MTALVHFARRPSLRACLYSGALCTLTWASAARADSGLATDQPALAATQLVELSLEDLANTKVTSVFKRAEPLSSAPASIFVISAESIRRAGVTTLPEALRLAPNLQVARVDARNYAVTARGFNNAFENKLLVLIDGRSVYTPLFSGVFWDAQDVIMDDVERIEVISGPGATLWGANAVNGVINIIRKSASASQGTLITVGADRLGHGAAARYGGTLDNGARYRAYGKTLEQDDTSRADGKPVLTGWHRTQTGFRLDTGAGASDVTVQGDAYSGKLHQAGTRDIEIDGANLLARLTRQLDDGSSVSLQAYWDYTGRDQPNAFIERLNTLDVQLQHALTVGRTHQVVWGAGYRYGADRIDNGPAFAFLPGALNMYWGNVFVQDDMALTDTLRLTAGAKVESNNYTGAEWLPSLRLAYQRNARSLIWGALSRTVRSPSRIDRDFYTPVAPKVVNGVPQYAIGGGPDFESETARVAELGYRAQPTATLSYSATLYHADYDRLRTLEPAATGVGSAFGNLGYGTTRGLETWASWQALPNWRLSGGLVTQRVRTQLRPGSKDASGSTGLATSDPSHFWSLRSALDLPHRQTLDVMVRHSAALDRPAVPSYTAVDLHYFVPLSSNLQLGITGSNLFDRRHAEYGSAATRSEYERALRVKLVWRM